MRWIVVGLLALVSDTHGASINCEKAVQRVDKAICNDPSLFRLDHELNWYYSKALKRLPDRRDQLVAEQRSWVKLRNSCPSNQCIQSQYKRRIQILDNLSRYSDQEANLIFDCIEALRVLEDYTPETQDQPRFDYSRIREDFGQYCLKYDFRIPIDDENSEHNRTNALRLDDELKLEGTNGPSYSRSYGAFGREPPLFSLSTP